MDGIRGQVIQDTYDIHLPGSKNIAAFIGGTEKLRAPSSPIDRIYFTHWIVGIFFYLLDITPFTSGLALMSLRLITAWIIFKTSLKIMEPHLAAIAMLIFSVAPTVLFYSLAFYKEAGVQLLLASFYYFYVTITRQFTIKSMLACMAFIGILLFERVYLALMLAMLLLVYLVFSKQVAAFIKLLLILPVVGSAYLIFKKYQNFYIDFYDVMESLQHVRKAYNNYSDVDPRFNTDLPYLLSVLKIYFTPIFTLRKFDLFKGYSTLLIWGGFFHQFVATSLIIGFFIKDRKIIFKDYLLLVPFLLFLLLFAYVAPYNGRLRDSFYPLISIFAAPTLYFIVRKSIKIISSLKTNDIS